MVTIDYEDCVDGPEDCEGELGEYSSRTGETRSIRCDFHLDAYDVRMDELERKLQERYPGYDVPGSPAPEWLDPAYAGERWDED